MCVAARSHLDTRQQLEQDGLLLGLANSLNNRRDVLLDKRSENRYIILVELLALLLLCSLELVHLDFFANTQSC